MFFEDCRPVEIFKTEADSGNLLQVKAEHKLLPESVRNNFVLAVRERRKFVNRQKQNIFMNDFDSQIDKPYDERSFASADFAIFRHYYDPYDTQRRKFERVVNEAEFSKFFDGIKQEKKDLLNSIQCVQTCVKSKIGLGQHIPVHFRVELLSELEERINTEFMDQTSVLKTYPPVFKYDFRSIGHDY